MSTAMRVLIAAAGLWPAVLASHAAGQTPPAGQPEPPPAAAETPEASESGPPELYWPTRGRPAFVSPGGVLTIVGRLGESLESAEAALIRRSGLPLRVELDLSKSNEAERAAGRISIPLPADLATGLYDLHIELPGQVSLVAPRGVSIGPQDGPVRLVHLSNMNAGELSVPELDRRLIEEVNLLGPTAVVLTGDLVDALCPDRRQAWQNASEFLDRLEAPAIIACGDHDGAAEYMRHVAPSVVGEVRIGQVRGVVLRDHPGAPLAGDAEQVRWANRVLGQPGDAAMTFIVSHDELPGLLEVWRREDVLSQMLSASRLGVWFSGGHTDWDGREYQELIAAAHPLLYLRTAQASGATIGGAPGTAHWRLVELNGREADVAGEPHLPVERRPSVAVGRLHVIFDGPNDGSTEQLAFTAVSRLPFGVRGLRARLFIRAAADAQTWVRGCVLESQFQVGSVREVCVRFDLPDKGVVLGRVGTGEAPVEPALQVRIDAPKVIECVPAATPDGVRYLRADSQAVSVAIANAGDEPVELEPLVRLDGDRLAYAATERALPLALSHRIRLEPGQQVVLRLDLGVIRLQPGRRELQVYPLGLRSSAPASRMVDIRLRS